MTSPDRRQRQAAKTVGVFLFLLAAVHYFELLGLRFPDFQR